jgi:hypothetical protein
MKKNIGGYDRLLRVIIGLCGIIFSFGIPKLLWVEIISVIILLTGVIGWCGVYAIFGVNTASTKKAVKKITKKATKKATKKKK